MKKITVLIPCYNEEKGIGKVIRGIPTEKLLKDGFKTKVVVIDNNSTDKTAEVAKKYGAIVISEKKQGKGHAIKTGFMSITEDTDYIVMLDGDDTYKPSEIPRLIEPLDSDFCDVIVGSRLGGKMLDGSLKTQNRIVNWGYAFLVRYFYHANITDVLSGFFAWKRETLDGLKLHLQADGFAIEMEMITKMMKLGYEIYSVPITYDVRQGESKISSLKDGLKILKMLFQNLHWNPTGSKKGKFSFKIGMWQL
ncbi:MAG: glycosyltransferase family 2 protein [Candidatus Shapirobacteria bacterium]|jgi:dolichol-phosphate mannosyltransferase